MDAVVTDKPKLKMHPSIQLASGAYFDFLNPETTPLAIEDIATGLSRICRFTGHLRDPKISGYTVAQHCVLASENGDTAGDPFEYLMHDSAESVIGDVSSPLKQLLPDYKIIEERVELQISAQYQLPFPMTKQCKAIDLRMLATEKRDLMPLDKDGDYWFLLEDVDPLPFVIEPWSPIEARTRFMHRYNYLRYGFVPDYGEPYAQPHAHAPEDYQAACRKTWGRLKSDLPLYMTAEEARKRSPKAAFDYAAFYDKIDAKIVAMSKQYSCLDIVNDLPATSMSGFQTILDTIKEHFVSLGYEFSYFGGHTRGSCVLKW